MIQLLYWYIGFVGFCPVMQIFVNFTFKLMTPTLREKNLHLHIVHVTQCRMLSVIMMIG